MKFKEVAATNERCRRVQSDANAQKEAPRRTSVVYALAQRDAPGFNALTATACETPPGEGSDERERQETSRLLGVEFREGMWRFEAEDIPVEFSETARATTTAVTRAEG